MRYSLVKGFLDRFAALLALLLLSPLLLLVSLLVRSRLGSPVLFRQQRPGYRGRPFWLLKFRTMTNGRDASGALLPDDQRLTPFGRWLRSTSIDELPELWNVLIGDMSLVGPRPLLMKYLPFYTSEETKRHNVLPGITGWAQINGRNRVSWDQRIALDAWYAENRSLSLDFYILFLTIFKVFTKEGFVGAPGQSMKDLDQERNV